MHALFAQPTASFYSLCLQMNRLWWRFAAIMALPALPAVGWAQTAQLPAQPQAEIRASDLRTIVRLHQASAAKNAQQAGISAQKEAQAIADAKSDSRHLNEEERVQLRKQLARELRAQK